MMSPLKRLLALLLFSLSQGCQPKVSALNRAIQGFGKFVTQNLKNCESQISWMWFAQAGTGWMTMSRQQPMVGKIRVNCKTFVNEWFSNSLLNHLRSTTTKSRPTLISVLKHISFQFREPQYKVLTWTKTTLSMLASWSSSSQGLHHQSSS